VLAMVCDSTNVFVEGESGSEGDVRKHLSKVIAECPQRVVVSTFASNLARVATVIQAAHDIGKVVALAGRSMHRVVEAAKESGYLAHDIELVSDKEVMSLPRKDVLVLCTGNQGEPRAALSRIARGDHPNIKLQPGDTVIFSSRKIPGNESRINRMHNQLVEKKVEVITDKNDVIHVSGHPARAELKRMYDMVRPHIAVPTHGEARHLHEHAKLAKSLGVKETVEAYNGAIVWLAKGEASVIGKVPSGYVAIDGISMIATDGDILRTRRKLRDDGAVFVSVVIGKNGDLMHPVQLVAPGLLDPKEDEELIAGCAADVTHALEHMKVKAGDSQIAEQVRLCVRKLLKKELDKKPVIEVHVARV
jgi:ribonuclease J